MRTGNVFGTDNRNDFLKAGAGRKNENRPIPGREDRADFIAMFEAAVADMKTLKRNDLALVYMKYLQIYSDLGKSGRSESAFAGQARNNLFEVALSGLPENERNEKEVSEAAPSNPAEERETTSDIIVKPDGSRVLVVTNSIGGMQTTMSIEISKPTDFPANAPQTESQAELQTGQAGIAPEKISASAIGQ